MGKTLYECHRCGHQTSVTAGTIFQDTHKPLKTWFQAIWLVTSQKTGASAVGVQRVLGLGSYKTAWSWLHKLRRAMVRPDRERLSGRIEVDEAYWGGEREGVRGRKTLGKSIILVAAQEDGSAIGRIRLRRVKSISAPCLHAFIEESIEPGSTVHTDGGGGYLGIEKKGYRHNVTALQGHKSASKLLPHVHRVISLLKRWLQGTHQGAIGHGHLDYYLDEFTFRFNRRTSRHRGKLFYRLLSQAVNVAPSPYKRMIHHARGRHAVNPNK